MSEVVLDASALLAYLNEEPAAEAVEEALASAEFPIPHETRGRLPLTLFLDVLLQILGCCGKKQRLRVRGLRQEVRLTPLTPKTPLRQHDWFEGSVEGSPH